MKLRNKKTGEVWETAVVNSYACGVGYRLLVTKDAYTQVGKHYDSLAELNEDWEDYKPAEPLIKDSKIRKAVRAWAETIKVKSVFVEKPSYERADLILSDNFATISFPVDKPKELNFCKRYTITELCGEEEE